MNKIVIIRTSLDIIVFVNHIKTFKKSSLIVEYIDNNRTLNKLNLETLSEIGPFFTDKNTDFVCYTLCSSQIAMRLNFVIIRSTVLKNFL